MRRTKALRILWGLAAWAIAGTVTWAQSPRFSTELSGWVSSVALDERGGRIAVAVSDSTARLWDVAAKRELVRLEGHTDRVSAITISPDSRTILTGSYDRDARTWDAESGKCRQTLSGHRGAVMAVAFQPDGKLLATGSIDGSIRLWDVASGDERGTLSGHRSWVNSLSFSGEGGVLASGSSDGTVRLWDVESRKSQRVIPMTKAEVRSVALSPDGRLVAAGIRYGEVQVWDTNTGMQVWRADGHKGDAWSVAFTPDGNRLVTGGGDWGEPGEVKLWDATSGRPLGKIPHGSEVLSVACSRDGRRLAVGGMGKTVAVWDLAAVAVKDASVPAVAAAEDAEYWIAPMQKVHEKFAGQRGTFAQFGDSITVTMAYWASLADNPKNLSRDGTTALELVKKTMQPDCWAKWKGPKYGSQGSMTIRWADENVDQWLADHKPETVLLMFGTNDVTQVPLDEYVRRSSAVVDRCLKAGSVAILSTIPPRSGQFEKSQQFAEAVRKLAKEKGVPLTDYQAEILRRRPDDWDGSLAKFKGTFKDVYEAPTLIAGDGVHPSNSSKFRDYSEESLNANGYVLRNYLTLTTYARVIERVLQRAEK